MLKVPARELPLFDGKRISRRDFFGYAARHTSTYLKDSIAGTAVDYEDFLKILTDERYNVSPITEYESSFRPDKVNVLLRHDMDYDNGYGMLELDYNHGFRSTSYLRMHADVFYKIEEVTKFYQLIEKYGFEVGYHYEVVDLTMKGSEIDWNAAEKLFPEELNFMRQSFNVRSVTPHGGFAGQSSKNFEFEKDQSRLSKYRVFSAYHIPFSKPVNFSYLTDTSYQFVSDGLNYFREGLGKAKPGDVIEILVHPEIGRWNYKYYQNGILPVLTPRTFQIPTTSMTFTASSTQSGSVTTSLVTSMSTSTLTSQSSSLTSQISVSPNSVLRITWPYLVPSIALCTLGGLAFYKIHQRRLERRSSGKFCMNCGREFPSNQRFCDRCGKPTA